MAKNCFHVGYRWDPETATYCTEAGAPIRAVVGRPQAHDVLEPVLVKNDRYMAIAANVDASFPGKVTTGLRN